MRVGASEMYHTQSCHRTNLISKKIKMCPTVTALDLYKGQKDSQGTIGERRWRGGAIGIVKRDESALRPA